MRSFFAPTYFHVQRDINSLSHYFKGIKTPTKRRFFVGKNPCNLDLLFNVMFFQVLISQSLTELEGRRILNMFDAESIV